MTDFDWVNFFRGTGPGRPLRLLRLGARRGAEAPEEPHAHGAFMITGHPEAMLVYGDPATFPDHDRLRKWSSCNAVSGAVREVLRTRERRGHHRGDPALPPRAPLQRRSRSTRPATCRTVTFLMRLITPKGLKENEDFMWRFADQLIDGFVDEGSCEFVGAYAEPFTLTVIADLEGVPNMMICSAIASTVHEHVGHTRSSSSTSASASTSPPGGPTSCVTTRSPASPPPPSRDGVHPEAQGRGALSPPTVRRVVGQETTVRMLSFVLRTVGDRPDLQQAAREDRDPHPHVHRGDAPPREPAAAPHGRTRTHATWPASTSPAGPQTSTQPRFPALATANPRVFEHPHEFDIERANAVPAHWLRPRHPHLPWERPSRWPRVG